VLYIVQLERRSRVSSSGALQTARLSLVDLAGSERLKKGERVENSTTLSEWRRSMACPFTARRRAAEPMPLSPPRAT
jgi:hypothetical protein